jgi:ribosomal protein S4
MLAAARYIHDLNAPQMRHPGYLLNPGDMFQVDPQRVMFATGAPKDPSEVSSAGDAEKALSEGEEDVAASEDQSDQTKEEEKEEEPEAQEEDPRKILKSLLAQAKSILGDSKGEKISAKRKQDIRGFQKQVKRQLSRSNSSTILTDSLEAQFLELKNQLLRNPNQSVSEQTPPQNTQPFEQTEKSESSQDPSSDLSPLDLTTLRLALENLHHNPLDSAKPYATPWTPRPYMSAFAFIPRYLEVNQNICAAVYLRHPVARPGIAEVPSPLGEGTSGEAFAWYLRRR